MKKNNVIFFAMLLAAVSCGKCIGNDAFIAKDSMPGGGVHKPADPGSGPSQDKRQEGDWTVYTISEGLEYWNFEEYDNISRANQIVNVVKLDLNNPSYSVKYAYSNSGIATSDVFKGRGAVAAINGAYELPSVFVKVNGEVLSDIPSDVIPNTSVPQWKSEGAVYTDGERGVSVEFSAKNCTLDETRRLYSASTRTNILTSAPMLVDNFDPVGTAFITRMPSYVPGINLTSLEYEDPVRHQGVRHPRTAVAMTEDNHFLMITVDGRWTGSAAGMSAAELTNFLVKHFNPKYALNMDGGGSTTMCVAGMGDARTHVVNYPCNDSVFDHIGERKVATHIYVMKNN